MRVIGSHTISTSLPRSAAVFRSVIVAVAMWISASAQIRHQLRENRILSLGPHARRVASGRDFGSLFRMAMGADVVAARLGSSPQPSLLATRCDAFARIPRAAFATYGDAVILN